MATTYPITTKFVDISPTLARKYLAKNSNNRPLSERRARAIAEAIQRGEWQVNGDTIRISDTGVLLDGQHRLRGIELSGCTVTSMVIEGLPEVVFNTIDTNARSRTAADILSIKGEANATVLASSARLLFNYKMNGTILDGHKDPTPVQLQEFIDKYPDIRDAVVSTASNNWAKRYMTPSIAGFCRFIFNRHNPAKTNEFFDLLASGAGLDPTSPVLLLRERLYASASDHKLSMNKKYRIALIFKAFKMFLRGSKAKSLNVKFDGTQKDRDLFKL